MLSVSLLGSIVFLALGHFFLLGGLVVVMIDSLPKPVSSFAWLGVDLIDIAISEIGLRRASPDRFFVLLLSSMFLLQQEGELLLECLHFLVDVIMHLGLYFPELVAGGLIDRYVLCAIAIDQCWRDFSSEFGQDSFFSSHLFYL